MMPIRLDSRLMHIAALVRGGSVADVGCDHGKLGYYLISTDRAKRVIATDISAPSLKKAEELFYINGVNNRAETRLGDGLKPIDDGEADIIIIAGLGGDVISTILKSAYDEGKRYESYILSPNTHPEKVRRILCEIEQEIVDDAMVKSGGKYYTVIKSQRGKQELDEMQQLFGAFYDRDVVFAERAERELEFINNALKENNSALQLMERKQMLESALKMCKKRG